MATEGKKNLSDLELDLLRHLASAGPLSVRAVAEGFGSRHGYARTTVMTVMERLRSKGYVTRRKVSGVYQYASALTPGELMRGVVGRFVDRALGGSVSPLVAYLAETGELTDAELAELRRLVDELSKKEGKP